MQNSLSQYLRAAAHAAAQLLGWNPIIELGRLLSRARPGILKIPDFIDTMGPNDFRWGGEHAD